MIKPSKNTLFATFMVVALFFTSLLMVPNAKALELTYSDDAFQSLRVSGSDVAKPGEKANITVLWQFAAPTNMTLRIRFYVDLSSLRIAIPDNDYNMNFINSTSDSRTYSVSIPPETLLNTYLYIGIDVNNIKHFTYLPITHIQNPTYSELAAQAALLQQQVNNLTAQVSSLQNQLNNIQSNSTALQNQINSLQSQVTSLQNQNAGLQFQVSNLQTEKSNLETQVSNLSNNASNLQTQVNTLQGEKASLQIQLDTLQTEKNSLQSQLSNLQTEKNTLENNNTSLQSQIQNLTNRNDQLQMQVNSLQTQINQLQLNNTNLQAIVTGLGQQIASLQEEANNLQAQNNTTSIVLYLAAFVAAIFIFTTAYVIYLTIQKNKKNQPATPQNETETTDQPQQIQT